MAQAVRLERIKDRIHVWFDYDPMLVAMMRAVAGRSFVKKPSPHWTVPCTMQHCRDLRSVFGDRLEIGPDLAAWARDQVAAEKSGAALGTVSHDAFAAATLTHAPRVAPRLYERMLGRPYQVPAAAFAASRPAIVADQPGLGKTTEIMAAIAERFPYETADVLIVAPKTSVDTVWVPEVRTWLGDLAGGVEITSVPEGRAKREKALAEFNRARGLSTRPRVMILCVNAEMVRVRGEWDADDHLVAYHHEYEGLFTRPWDGIVVDEGHKYLITRYSQPHLKKMSQTRRGLAMLPTNPEPLRIAASGTPFKGRTANLWGTLNWLYPKQFTAFWTWADQYLEVTDNGFGKDIGGLRPSRAKDLYRSLDAVMIRRTKGELRRLNPAWAPPDKEYQQVLCAMGPKQRAQYDAMAANAALTVDGGSLTADGVLAEITRLKQLAHSAGTITDGVFAPALPSAKFDKVVEMLRERGISGDADERGEGVKVVIASQFTQILDLYSAELKRLGVDHFLLTGNTKPADRKAYVDRFQQPGGPRVFMLNTAAGGVSITLDAADELWMLDETWVPDDQEQVEDRVHRTSNVDHQVTIYYFVTMGTIEEEIAQVTAEKDSTQKKHLDGRRGVEFVKEWAAAKKTA